MRPSIDVWLWLGVSGIVALTAVIVWMYFPEPGLAIPAPAAVRPS